jgi:hypothetical protein
LTFEPDVVGRVWELASTCPDQVAVAGHGGVASYAALAGRASMIARRLAAAGTARR